MDKLTKGTWIVNSIVFCAVLAICYLRIGLKTDDHGVRIVNPFRTWTLDWAEIAEVDRISTGPFSATLGIAKLSDAASMSPRRSASDHADITSMSSGSASPAISLGAGPAGADASAPPSSFPSPHPASVASERASATRSGSGLIAAIIA